MELEKRFCKLIFFFDEGENCGFAFLEVDFSQTVFGYLTLIRIDFRNYLSPLAHWF